MSLYIKSERLFLGVYAGYCYSLKEKFSKMLHDEPPPPSLDSPRSHCSSPLAQAGEK